MSCQVYSVQNNDFTSNQHQEYYKQIDNLKTQIIHLTNVIEQERKNRQSDYFSIAEQIRDIQAKNINPCLNANRVSITSSRASLTSRRNQRDDQKLNPEQDGLAVNELSRCLSQNRLSIHQPIIVQNTIKQDFNLMMKQFSQFKNQIKLDIATLNDNISDMNQNVQQCLKNIGNKGNIKVLINKVLDMEEKSNHLLNFSQKTVQQIEFLKDQVEYLTNTSTKMNQGFDQDLSKVLNNCLSIRQQIESSQAELSDCFSRKLSKIIQSYNLNFQDMDRSINEIKEVIVDVVKINKIIKQKIGVKLSNVIDNQTFQRTIQGLNQNLHSTYLLSHEKIKQINQRDFQVQNQLHQMKDALDYLQSDYNYNRTRLNQSITSDENFQIENFNDQNSTLVSQNMVSFKKKKTQTNSIAQSKRKQQIKQQNDNDSISDSSNKSDKKISLADELRQLEMQQ